MTNGERRKCTMALMPVQTRERAPFCAPCLSYFIASSAWPHLCSMVVGTCAHNQTQRAPPLLPRWAPPWPQVPRRVFCCFVVLPRQHLTTPHRTAPYHTTFPRIAPHRTAQHFTARHRTAPYRTASHRTAPHRNLSTTPTHTSPHHATRMPHCISPHHTHLTTPLS